MTTYRRHTYCSFCGSAYPEAMPWPRRCPTCANTTYVNPLPVAVTLLPVGGGLLLVRRAIPPKLGELALPGGFINLGESWQHACARELAEETGITTDPAHIRPLTVLSADDGMLLVFGIAPPLPGGTLPTLAPNDEVSELAILHAPAELAFPLHTQAAALYFRQLHEQGGAQPLES